MKHLLKITSAVLVLLLCALGGVFLWRSGFFAALSSQPVSYTHLDVYKRQVPEYPFFSAEFQNSKTPSFSSTSACPCSIDVYKRQPHRSW